MGCALCQSISYSLKFAGEYAEANEPIPDEVTVLNGIVLVGCRIFPGFFGIVYSNYRNVLLDHSLFETMLKYAVPETVDPVNAGEKPRKILKLKDMPDDIRPPIHKLDSGDRGYLITT